MTKGRTHKACGVRHEVGFGFFGKRTRMKNHMVMKLGGFIHVFLLFFTRSWPEMMSLIFAKHMRTKKSGDHEFGIF